MSEATTENEPYPPYATIVLIKKELDPQHITELLGINPTKGVKQGDKRGDKYKWPHGIWALESKGQLESNDPILHIEWLIEKLEPAKTKLTEILSDDGISAKIDCFWIMPSTHEVLTIPPELLSRIGGLNIRFELSIYAP